MKKIVSAWPAACLVPALACLLSACGSDVELRPELQVQLDAYEQLIESYQPRFAGVRGDPPAFKKVADAYGEDLEAWMARWDTLAPTLTDDEGHAAKARIDRLNKRAVKMLQAY